MRILTYINRQTLEKTTSLEAARNEWGNNFETVLIDNNKTADAERDRVTRARARVEALRAKKNK